MKLFTILSATAGMFVAAACASPPAQAGEWRLNPAACPDLREDFRDSRVVTGRRDLREDRRDRRVVSCPARAYTYYPSRWERWRGAALPPRPAFTGVYFEGGHYYGAVRRGSPVRLVVVVRD